MNSITCIYLIISAIITFPSNYKIKYSQTTEQPQTKIKSKLKTTPQTCQIPNEHRRLITNNDNISTNSTRNFHNLFII